MFLVNIVIIRSIEQFLFIYLFIYLILNGTRSKERKRKCSRWLCITLPNVFTVTGLEHKSLLWSYVNVCAFFLCTIYFHDKYIKKRHAVHNEGGTTTERNISLGLPVTMNPLVCSVRDTATGQLIATTLLLASPMCSYLYL